jgi:hypothetical protein
MTEDQQARVEGTAPAPNFERSKVDWYKGKLGLKAFVSSYPGLPSNVREEARYTPAVIGLGLQFCNILRGQQQQLDLLDEVGRLSLRTRWSVQLYLEPRKAAMQLSHVKAVFMMVDSTGQILSALRSPVGSFTLGLGCQHHGLCSHATHSCVGIDAVAHLHLVDQAPVAFHPAQRLHFDAADEHSAIICIFNGVLAVAHRPLRGTALRLLQRALDMLADLFSEPADKRWCEGQKQRLRARFKLNQRSPFPKAVLATQYQGMMSPGFPITPALPNPEPDYIQSLANQEATRICDITAAAGPNSSAETVASPRQPLGACSNQGAAAEANRLSVFHPERMELSSAEGPARVMVDASPAVPQAPRPWETTRGLCDAVIHLIKYRQGWPTAVFGVPDRPNDGTDAFYEVGCYDMAAVLPLHVIPWRHPRFLGVLRGAVLIRAGQVTVDLEQYFYNGGAFFCEQSAVTVSCFSLQCESQGG